MTEMMRLPSKYFGEIEYESKDVIHFASGPLTAAAEGCFASRA